MRNRFLAFLFNHLHMSLLGRRVLGNLRLSYTFWAPKESASVCRG